MAGGTSAAASGLHTEAACRSLGLGCQADGGGHGHVELGFGSVAAMLVQDG